MTKLSVYNPMRDLMNMQREFDRVFSDLMRPGEGNGTRWMPTADIEETEEAFLITLDLPGLKKEDLDLTFEDGNLKVSGERTITRQDRQFHHTERVHGTFFRSFRLGDRVDPQQIEARFEDGVLTITAPKAEVVKPIKVQVS